MIKPHSFRESTTLEYCWDLLLLVAIRGFSFRMILCVERSEDIIRKKSHILLSCFCQCLWIVHSWL